MKPIITKLNSTTTNKQTKRNQCKYITPPPVTNTQPNNIWICSDDVFQNRFISKIRNQQKKKRNDFEYLYLSHQINILQKHRIAFYEKMYYYTNSEINGNEPITKQKSKCIS